MWSFFSRDPSKEFLYEILEQISGTEEFMVWKLHKGKKKGTSELVSVFVLDARASGDTQLELAKSALKRLKTLRHPSILTYVDSLETEKCLYLVTEYIEPLQFFLNNYSINHVHSKEQKELFIAWGLFQVTRAITFLINDVNLQHNGICCGNIFVNSAGEWKLGGFEYAESCLTSSLPTKLLPSFEKYDPPEKLDHSKLKFATKWSADMWGLGCLIWEVFNGSLKSSSSLQGLGNIPKLLTSVYCELVGANPSARPNPSEVLVKCRMPGGYFSNDLVECLVFLEEIQIKESSEKGVFFNKLPALLENFPDNLSKHKVLPQLINAFDFGNAGASVLAPLFKLGSLLSEEEYQKKIVPCVVKMFSSPDRATRLRLLQQLENFSVHLLPVTVNDHIFPHILSGFMDSNPIIREHTVKSIISLAPKLNYNNLNIEVLKHFARLQSKDDQGGIRTNTTVCLGKIASYLHPQVRQKVLVSAFTRALRDPFPSARIGGVLAFAATQQYYLLSQISNQILPALCLLAGDPEREVRDQAFKVIKGFLNKLEKVSEDPSLKESMEADVNANASPNVTDMASTWAGWAVSAVASKFYKSPGNQVTQESIQLSPSVNSESSSSIKSTSSKELVTSDELQIHPCTDNDTCIQWGDINNYSKTCGPAAENDGWEVQEDWTPIDKSPEQPSPVNKTDNRISSNIVNTNSEEKEIGWESWNTNAWPASDTDKNEARKKREEKRILRQKEIEAKRNARQGSNGVSNTGSLKLGEKKLQNY